MRWEIRRITKAAGTTAVYVTHDQAEALSIADRIAVMREGRVVQVGTGRELYEAPGSRFVADFLGEANFLPATVAAVDRGRVALDSPLGRLAGRSAGEVRAGQAVRCCIRPESLRLEAAGGSGENAFAARLTEWHHLGELARFALQAGGDVTLSGAAMPARPLADCGAELTVRVDPDDVIVLTS
jgi:ABC-type Fe3+/spermidine/putrescine transport system ATPase subunit